MKKQAIGHAEQLFRMSLGLQKFNKKLEKRTGLSLVQWYLLRRLVERPGIAAGALAREVGVSPGTLTPLLQRLKQKGWLYLEQDGLDSRKKTILISRAGREQLLSGEKNLTRVLSDSAPLPESVIGKLFPAAL